MTSRLSVLSLAALVPVLFLAGCNNALNPLCDSSRPAPLISSLAPSTVAFSQVQQGTELVINGSQFVSTSEVVINGQVLGATVISSQQLKVPLTTGVITAPGAFKVNVRTPSGNTSDLGCTSGGNSTALTLTVN